MPAPLSLFFSFYLCMHTCPSIPMLVHRVGVHTHTYMEYDMTTKLYIEVECGGDDALGGGCGAPLDFYETTQERFDSLKGPIHDKPTNTSVREMKDWYEIEWEGGLIRVACRPCRECNRARYEY